MAVQLGNLTVYQTGDKKKVREYVSSPQGIIEVYEPTLEMANEILAIQKENGFDLGSDIIRFDEVVLLKRVFPLLTSIETDGMTDEEIAEVAENPSIHLLIIQNIVAQVISEVNKLYAERLKAELISAESILAQTDLINSIPNAINEHAKRDPKIADRLKKLEALQKEVEQAEQKEEKLTQEVVDENNV